MNRYRLILVALFMSSTLNCFGQDRFENTLEYDESAGSPRAGLGDVAWIAGQWRGEALGGVVEENWSRPFGGSMMAAFKLTVNGQVRFYELETIVEVDDTLLLRLKHFSADLHGWEARDETVDFRLVKVTDDRVYFDGMTFEKVGNDEMNVYVVIGDRGEEKETKFTYRRYE
jgi:hypothetical protein